MNQNKDQELTVYVSFKIRDVLRYNMWVMFRSIVNKVVLLIGVVLIGIFIYNISNREISLDLFIAQNIMLLFIPVMIFLLIPWRVWKITISQMQIPAFAFGVTYTFLSDKIILDTGEVKDEIAWDTFIKITETKNDFRFFVDAIRAQLIPKHNLTKEEIILFKSIAVKAAKEGICKFKAI